MNVTTNRLAIVNGWIRRALGAAIVAACSMAGATEVNTAPQAELEKVRGIGTSLSARLIEERSKRPFADWADLAERVRGVGPASAKRLSGEGLTVNGKPYAAAAEAPARKASR